MKSEQMKEKFLNITNGNSISKSGLMGEANEGKIGVEPSFLLKDLYMMRTVR